MKLYKLTDKDGYTYKRSLHWDVGSTHTAAVGEPVLCSPTVIHAYQSPLLAELMDIWHGNYGSTKRLWEATGDVVVSDGIKVGVKSLTLGVEIPVPTITTSQRAAFAIHCAMEVHHDPKWTAWANDWLNGTNRTRDAARAADAAARAADAAHAAADVAYAARRIKQLDFVSIAEKAMLIT